MIRGLSRNRKKKNAFSSSKLSLQIGYNSHNYQNFEFLFKQKFTAYSIIWTLAK